MSMLSSLVMSVALLQKRRGFEVDPPGSPKETCADRACLRRLDLKGLLATPTTCSAMVHVSRVVTM